MIKSSINPDSIKSFLDDLGCDYGLEFMKHAQTKINAIKDNEDISIWQIMGEIHREHPELPMKPWDGTKSYNTRFNSK